MFSLILVLKYKFQVTNGTSQHLPILSHLKRKSRPKYERRWIAKDGVTYEPDGHIAFFDPANPPQLQATKGWEQADFQNLAIARHGNYQDFIESSPGSNNLWKLQEDEISLLTLDI